MCAVMILHDLYTYVVDKRTNLRVYNNLCIMYVNQTQVQNKKLLRIYIFLMVQKSCATWDVSNLVNNWIKLPFSTGDRPDFCSINSMRWFQHIISKSNDQRPWRLARWWVVQCHSSFGYSEWFTSEVGGFGWIWASGVCEKKTQLSNTKKGYKRLFRGFVGDDKLSWDCKKLL